MNGRRKGGHFFMELENMSRKHTSSQDRSADKVAKAAAKTLRKANMRDPEFRIARLRRKSGGDSIRLVHSLRMLDPGMRNRIIPLLWLPERQALENEERRIAEKKAATRRPLPKAAERPDKPVITIEAARRSALTIGELHRMNFSKSQIKSATAWRASGLPLTASAEYLSIPKGRLDRYDREGLIPHAFKRRIAVYGKMVEARMWRTEELDQAKLRMAGIEWMSQANLKAGRR